MGSRGVWNSCETATVAALLALVFLHPTTVAAAGVVGAGTADSCTDAALDAKLAGGGMVTFDCGAGPVTITLSAEKVITAEMGETTVEGGGLVTLSGGGTVRVFHVNAGGTLDVRNLTIANGSAPYVANVGGGIYNEGTLTVINSTFTGNSANGGGGISNEGGTGTVTNSTFSGNTALDGGGILNILNGTLTVTNSTFSGNSAHLGSCAGVPCGGSGGAILIQDGTVTVTNSTFSGNSAGGAGGGGIGNFGTLTVTNTIVANSTSGGNCSGTITDGGHNIDDGATCGFSGTGCTSTSSTSFCNTDPQLDPAGLANNGGPTQTIALCTGTGAPSAGCTGASPAINAGDESVCSTTTGTAPVNNLDQRGFARPGEGATNCSIGAFEANSSGPLPVTVTPTPTPTTTPSPSPTATPTVTRTATPTATTTPTASATPSPSITATTRPSDGGGGGCTVTPTHRAGAAWWLLVPVAVLARAQRRKRV